MTTAKKHAGTRSSMQSSTSLTGRGWLRMLGGATGLVTLCSAVPD